MNYQIKDYKVNVLPTKGEPNSKYYVSIPNTNEIELYITDQLGNYRRVSSQGVDSYVHNQNVALSTWTITHPLAYYPNVSIVDSAGSVVIGDIQYINSTTITATFSGAFSGKAYLS